MVVSSRPSALAFRLLKQQTREALIETLFRLMATSSSDCDPKPGVSPESVKSRCSHPLGILADKGLFGDI